MQWEPGNRYLISYAAESGRTSARTIDVIRTSRAGDGRVFIRAWCHLRGEERTFRADRVIHAEQLPAARPRAGGTGQARTAAGPVRPAEQPPVRPAMHLDWPAAQQVRSAAPEPRRAAPEEPSAGGGGKAAAAFFGIAVGVAVLLAYRSTLPGPGPSPFASTDTAIASAAGLQPGSRPLPPPKPALEETTIGGYLLRTIRSNGLERFEVPELGLATADKLEAVSAIRLPAFVEAMGFFDADIASRYLDADLNGSGRLAFEELKVFQDKTYRDFRYEPNGLALRPDEFLKAGGGDCEDFALYTAGLLRFWGWEPYIGSMAPSKSGIGHAICLSFEEGAFPDDFTYFELEAWTTEDGTALRAGSYVPIDYSHVGSLSNAVGPGWKLRSVYIPEKAWGLSM